MFAECTETVSILYAIVFGAGEACIMISTWSMLSALGVFLVLVLIAQFLARRLWVGLRASDPPQRRRRIGTIMDDPITDDPNYDDSAIRSTRR